MKKNRMLVCLMALTMMLGSTGLLGAFADNSASLTVVKSVIGSQQNPSESFEIVVTINGTSTTVSLANGGSAVFEGLPYSSAYSVTETAGAGYTATYTNGSGTMMDEPVTATVINTVIAMPSSEAAPQPMAEVSLTEAPVVEELSLEEPAAEEPAVEQPVAEEPVAEEPVAEEPVAEEPVAEEPVAEEPLVGEPVAEQPVVEEPVAEEPAAEEPVAEQPMAEQPVAEELIPEESVTIAPLEIAPAAEAALIEEAAPAPSAIVVPVGTLTIGGSALYLYAAPSADAEKLMTLDPASQVTVLSQDEAWALVDFQGTQGYVPKLNLVIEAPVSLDNLAVYAWFVNEPEKVHYGDMLTLQGKLMGFENLPYEYYTVWQRASMSESRAVGNDWVDIGGANALTYSFTVNEANEWYGWRLAVRVTVPDDVGIGN